MEVNISITAIITGLIILLILLGIIAVIITTILFFKNKDKKEFLFDYIIILFKYLFLIGILIILLYLIQGIIIINFHR